MTTTEKDLAKVSDLREYLENTPFAAEEIVMFSDGIVNFAFRIKLKTPYDGRSTMVVKHAKPYMAKLLDQDNNNIPFDLERQRYEVEALNHVHALIPPDSLVTVPRVNHFDEKENVIIMDDCGTDSVTLKKFMIDGRCTPALAEKIGDALGSFLGGLHHTWGKNGIARLMETLREHKQGKEVCVWAVYGRLGSTIRGEDPTLNISENPPEVGETEFKRMEEIGKEISADMLSEEEDLVMGDFWPGNVLIDLADGGSDINRMFVIDWELAKPGLQALDIGEFCAEVDLIRRFHASSATVCSRMIASFYRSYSNLDVKKDVALYQTALAHWGAHLTVWTSQGKWGGVEETRIVITDGVKLLVEGYECPGDEIERRYQ
ncbi:hypothetical protein E1B28_001576 [Marasmius oreades]|uniref:Aminoglycoside phosphotransferase domain-containing protein n=1 Tax=Marasmius oreades TaxID=181124 RepID=A0A9P8AFP6_9AGAR|nr:uncharacterized protein E1B28_001576 [Marasmius oreades]KAG7099763.1 hypothetical protein E1B28_001576 [Marasmius oreades]